MKDFFRNEKRRKDAFNMIGGFIKISKQGAFIVAEDIVKYANQGFEKTRDLYDDEDFLKNAKQGAFNVAKNVMNYANQGFKNM